MFVCEHTSVIKSKDYNCEVFFAENYEEAREWCLNMREVYPDPLLHKIHCYEAERF